MSAFGFNVNTRERYVEADGTEVITEAETDRSLHIRPDGEVTYRGGTESPLVITAREELHLLQDGGVDGILIANEFSLPYEKNVEVTRKVVEYAHQFDVTVEGELGVLAGIEDEVASEVTHYTRPEEVEDFVSKTGVDSLAISIGTSHGANKFKPEQCTRNADGILIPPPLRFDILKEIEVKLPGFPIVLHGSSSVPQEYVKMINEHGGKLKDSVGIPEEQLREAAKSAVCKINIDSDGRLAMTGTIRRIFDEQPSVFDPRKYLGPARDALKEMYMHKNIDVLGSAGHALD